MNLLKEGIEIKSVIKTDKTKNVVIDNVAKTYPVYKIKLDCLYYNDKNDRISTWISEYKESNQLEEIDNSDIKKYNSIIHGFITKSNANRLKKTQKNIETVGQLEPGVVLKDGRIIDGNRRFTCLRNIEKATHFEAIILDHTIENNAKEIKLLELMLQHGVDEKVEYNPIDKLVGLYKDIIETNLITVEEYAKSVDQKPKDIKKEVEKAKLMVEFLEFINAPKQFHIARHLNLNDPLKDLNSILFKIKDEDKREDVKNIAFAQLLIQPEGDMTRYVRKVGKIVTEDKFSDDYIKEQLDNTEKMINKLMDYSDISRKEISEIMADEELKRGFINATEKHLTKTNSYKVRNQPLDIIDKAQTHLESIDYHIFKKMENDKKEILENKLNELMEYTKYILGKLYE